MQIRTLYWPSALSVFLLIAGCTLSNATFVSASTPKSDVVALNCSGNCGTIRACDFTHPHDLRQQNQVFLDPGCYRLEVLSYIALNPFSQNSYSTVQLNLKPSHHYRITHDYGSVILITITDLETGEELYNSRWIP